MFIYLFKPLETMAIIIIEGGLRFIKNHVYAR